MKDMTREKISHGEYYQPLQLTSRILLYS